MSVRMIAATASVLLAGAVLLAPQSAPAQDLQVELEGVVKDYLASHPDDVGQIAKQYFIEHPEAVNEILVEVLKQHRQQQAKAGPRPAPQGKVAPEQSAAIAKDGAALFSSPHQATLGDQSGDVTLVEFFDYNCGYCRHALSDMTGLLTADPKLKLVLKEFPILGEGSVEAARVAIAVRMQDPGKYLAFHEALLGGRGPANKETALIVAKSLGLDTARIENDMQSDEINATLAENAGLARDLGLGGTPSYVIGKDVLVGAVGLAALDEEIKAVRTRSD